MGTYVDTKAGTTTRRAAAAAAREGTFYVTAGSAGTCPVRQEFVTVGVMAVATKYGSIDAGGKRNNTQAWVLAYETSLALHALAMGSVWVPCYVCGAWCDAWTMDVEHMVPGERRRTAPGRVLLACATCNRRVKGEIYGFVAASVREHVERVGGSIPVRQVAPNNSAFRLRDARARRSGRGGDCQDSTYAAA